MLATWCLYSLPLVLALLVLVFITVGACPLVCVFIALDACHLVLVFIALGACTVVRLFITLGACVEQVRIPSRSDKVLAAPPVSKSTVKLTDANKSTRTEDVRNNIVLVCVFHASP